ncbi:MFS transporter [Allorhizocola rhizosphaerae]|uniref:MFS transporter n=1 Tax=Allorhizocola rhizosphaerae TaxID=1872709 RepID=UPI000E3C8502|nr:MFS transporter [Allorhizocola rhizosphaerae]
MNLWRHGDFMKLWTAQSISMLGSQVTILALPLAAVLLLDASAFEVGLLTAFGYLPFLLVGLPAGVWVDRMRRRPVLILTDLGRAAILLLVPVLWWIDLLSIEILYPITFAVGVLTVFFDIAQQSYLPSIVDRNQLSDGNAKLEISYSGAQLAGPAVAGGLVQILTAPVAILVDAVSYLCSAVSLLLIRHREPAPERAAAEASLVSEIRVGLRFVLRHPLLRPIAVTTGVGNLFDLFGMVAAVLVLFAVRDLDMTPAALGIALAIANVGALVGAVVNSALVRRIGVGPAIALSSVVPGLAVLMLPLATPATAIAVIGGALCLCGFAIAVYNINQISLRQAVTPERLQGRMNATMRFLIWGTLPIGTVLGGVLGDWIGLRPTLVIAGVGSMLACLPLVLSPIRTLREVPVLDETADLAKVSADEH